MPRRPPLTTRTPAGGAALPFLLLVTACSPRHDATGPVPVADAAPSRLTDASWCARLLPALPRTLAGHLRPRAVTAAHGALASAWGDPAVVLVCGVDGPSAFAEPIVVDGVSWVVTHTSGQRVWTTRGRAAQVAVRVPDDYQNQADELTPLSDTVARTLPAVPA